MNNVPPLTLARRLRIAREHADMTVHDMSTALGVGRNTIPRWESGSHTPNLGMVKQWAAETGVSLGYLLGDEVAETIPAHLERRRTRQTPRGGSQVVTHLPPRSGPDDAGGITIGNPKPHREAAALMLVAA